MNNKRPTPHVQPAEPQPFQTLDLASLEDINGGINWKYQMYRAAGAISSWDPSMVAASLIM
jgi:hypothetical protein